MGMLSRMGGAIAANARSFGIIGGQSKRDAARHDLSEFSGWSPQLDFAGQNYDNEWEKITGRARSLDEDNGWINGGLDRRVESVIGENIRLSAQPEYSLLDEDYEWRMQWTADVQSRFKIWSNDIERRNDVRKMLSFGAQARLAYLTYARDGRVAAELRDLDRGNSNPTAVLLIEPERISTPQDRAIIESPSLRNGITFDSNGSPTGYWVRSGHPNDPYQGFDGYRWNWVPASGPTGRARFLHVFAPRRVEQNIGVSKLAEAMLPAKMLDRVDRAEVNAALKSAIFSLFIKSPGTTDDLSAALAPSGKKQMDPWVQAYIDQRKKSPVVVDGAQINQLLPDEDVVAPERASPNANYPDFARFVLQKIAGSLGVSYPQISQDWAGINYSSARALLNELWRSFLQDRRFFCQHFLSPIYAAWLEYEVANGDVRVPGGPSNFYRQKTAICMAEWIGPGRGSVDPLKEANANNLDESAGRKSTPESILETGRDPSDVLSEDAWWRAEREKRGLDPSNYNVKQSTQESQTNAEREDQRETAIEEGDVA